MVDVLLMTLFKTIQVVVEDGAGFLEMEMEEKEEVFSLTLLTFNFTYLATNCGLWWCDMNRVHNFQDLKNNFFYFKNSPYGSNY